MKLRLQNLERIYKQSIMLLVDVITILLALWFAIALRKGDAWPEDYLYDSLWIFIAIPIVTIPFFIKLGLYQVSFATYRHKGYYYNISSHYNKLFDCWVFYDVF